MCLRIAHLTLASHQPVRLGRPRPLAALYLALDASRLSFVRLLFLQLFPLALPTIDAEALLRKRRDSQTSRENLWQ